MPELNSILALPTEADQRPALIQWVNENSNDVKFIIAFSGGKDSIAMVLYCLFDLKIPADRIELWHHDVDGDGEQLFDWPCTKSYCIAFAKAFGLTILFSYAGGGILREIYRTNETIQPIYFQKVEGGEYTRVDPQNKERFYNTRRKFPAVSADLNVRWCSWIAKISVMLKGINHTDRYQNANIVILTGERRLESTARSKYKEMELYRGASKTRRAVQWRPLIGWSERDVWAIIEKYKVQPHPCYELGWGRCSCQLCIFSNENIWAAINEISPEKVQRIAEIEDDLSFTLYGDKKNGNVNVFAAKVLKGVSFIHVAAKQRWLKEALGEFTSDIIVETWQLPAGAFSVEASGAN